MSSNLDYRFVAAVLATLGAVACTQPAGEEVAPASSSGVSRETNGAGAASATTAAGVIDLEKFRAATAAVDDRLVSSDFCTADQKSTMVKYRDDLATTKSVEVYTGGSGERMAIQWFLSPLDIGDKGVVTELTGLFVRPNGTKLSFRRHLGEADPSSADALLDPASYRSDRFDPLFATHCGSALCIGGQLLSQETGRDVRVGGDGRVHPDSLGNFASQMYGYALYRHEMKYREWAVSSPKTISCYDRYNVFRGY